MDDPAEVVSNWDARMGSSDPQSYFVYASKTYGGFQTGNTSGRFLAEDGKANFQPAKITLDANGGSVSPAVTQTSQFGISPLPSAKRDGFVFNGWCTARDSGDQVTAETVPVESTAYYAHWRER